MNLKAATILFFELQKSDIEIVQKHNYNSFGKKECKEYLEYIEELTVDFYTEFQQNLFEGQLDYIDLVNTEISKCQAAVKHRTKGSVRDDINESLVEERVSSSRLFQLIFDYRRKKNSEVANFVMEKYAAISKIVNKSLKHYSCNELPKEKKIKSELTKSELTMLFLLLRASEMIKFDTIQEMKSFIQNHFLYYKSTSKSFSEVRGLDTQISRIKGASYANPDNLKHQIIQKLSNSAI